MARPRPTGYEIWTAAPNDGVLSGMRFLGRRRKKHDKHISRTSFTISSPEDAASFMEAYGLVAPNGGVDSGLLRTILAPGSTQGLAALHATPHCLIVNYISENDPVLAHAQIPRSGGPAFDCVLPVAAFGECALRGARTSMNSNVVVSLDGSTLRIGGASAPVRNLRESNFQLMKTLPKVESRCAPEDLARGVSVGGRNFSFSPAVAKSMARSGPLDPLNLGFIDDRLAVFTAQTRVVSKVGSMTLVKARYAFATNP